jgi:hypothetical protein
MSFLGKPDQRDEEVDARSLLVFRKWSPNEGTTFLQFVARIDGAGGFAAVETDDSALIALRYCHFQPVLRHEGLPGSGYRGGGRDRRSNRVLPIGVISGSSLPAAAGGSAQTAQAFLRFCGRAPRNRGDVLPVAGYRYTVAAKRQHARHGKDGPPGKGMVSCRW